MIVIDRKTMDRIYALTKMPRSEYTVDDIMKNIAAQSLDPVLFVDLVELQLKAIDAALTFAEQRKDREGNSFMRIMSSTAATFGYVVSRASRLEPCQGQDVARAMSAHCTELFAEALAHNIAWVAAPAPPKPPTHQNNNSIN